MVCFCPLNARPSSFFLQLPSNPRECIFATLSLPPSLSLSQRDGTAKLWQLGGEASCVATLADHENGVCVLGLPTGDVATGSTGKQQDGGIAGCRVRVWRLTGGGGGSEGSGGWFCAATHEDHGGPVRSLCLAPQGGGLGFASTSNDGTTIVRNLAGDALHSAAHPSSGRGENFVYGAAALGLDQHAASAASQGAAGGEASGPQAFVSCSEDCSAAVWEVPPASSSSPGGGVCEVIEHPDGVWCVCTLPGGDFATGGNDGAVRLWTRDPGRAASAAAQDAWAQAVAAAKASRQGGPSPEAVAKLPAWANRLAGPGRREGDVKVFNKGGVAVAAQWAAASADWVEV